MTVLAIGDSEKAAIRYLINRAESNRISYTTMFANAEAYKNGCTAPPPIMRDLTIEIPIGFTAAYSIEEHMPGAWFKHFSIGLRTTPGRGPNRHAAAMLIEAFGFVNKIEQCEVWSEPLDDKTFAINVLEPLDGDWSKTFPKQ